MAYRIETSDSSVQAAVRRIAGEQIAKAMASIDDSNMDLADKVHDVRKRCKKLRGLIRLVRPVFADYKSENRTFRDIAGMLSYLRDNKVMADTYDLVVNHYDDQIDRQQAGLIRRRFTIERRKTVEEAQIDSLLSQCRSRLEAAAVRAGNWRIKKKGWEALSGGLAKSYDRAREAMIVARDGGDVEDHHEWRKRAKYHWYHCRLLGPIWPTAFSARAQEAHRMSDLLGDHHDLAVFRERLSENPGDYADEETEMLITTLAEKRAESLSDSAAQLGARLLCESPKKLDKRFHRYWKVWRREAVAD